jgi:hypothetical protein
MSESTSSNILPDREKLGDRNYKNWEWQMRANLELKGWAAYITPEAATARVSGSTTPPASDATPGTATPSTSRTTTAGRPGFVYDPEIDSKALALIKINVKPENYPHIMNAKTAREAWKALETHHKQLIKIQLLDLSAQLETITMRGNESVNQYISRAKGLWLELISAGSNKSEQEAVISVMRGLPRQYDTTVQIYRMTKDKLSFDTLHPVLLSADSMSHNPRRQEVTALFAGGGRGRGSGSSSRGRGRHNFSGGRGGSSNRSSNTSRDNSSKECHYCGHLGHLKSECHTKQRDERNGINRSSMPEAERQANKEKSLARRNTGGTGTNNSSTSSKPNMSVTPVTLRRKVVQPFLQPVLAFLER